MKCGGWLESQVGELRSEWSWEGECNFWNPTFERCWGGEFGERSSGAGPGDKPAGKQPAATGVTEVKSMRQGINYTERKGQGRDWWLCPQPAKDPWETRKWSDGGRKRGEASAGPEGDLGSGLICCWWKAETEEMELNLARERFPGGKPSVWAFCLIYRDVPFHLSGVLWLTERSHLAAVESILGIVYYRSILPAEENCLGPWTVDVLPQGPCSK